MKSSNNDINDSELIRYYLDSGDESYFKILFNRHNEKLISKLCNKMGSRCNSQDAMQTAWMKAFYNLRKYTDNNFSGWLYHIAYHVYISFFIRKNKEISYWHFDNLNLSEEPYKEYDTTLLQESILKIKKKSYRDVVLLKTYRNIPHKDISFHMKINMNTSLGSYRYGLMKLKKIMEEAGYTYEKE